MFFLYFSYVYIYLLHINHNNKSPFIINRKQINTVMNTVENIPEIFISNKNVQPDLFVYDFKMTHDVVKIKVNLDMNMFSFLRIGKKQVQLLLPELS